MQCATPVISSNVSSLPEVVGDAGLLINPEKKEDLVDAIAQLIKDDSLRAELSHKALAQAKRFSWSKVAHDTAAVYKAAVDFRS